MSDPHDSPESDELPIPDDSPSPAAEDEATNDTSTPRGNTSDSETWQPPRGIIFRTVVWFVLILILLSLLAMMVLVLCGGAGHHNPS